MQLTQLAPSSFSHGSVSWPRSQRASSSSSCVAQSTCGGAQTRHSPTHNRCISPAPGCKECVEMDSLTQSHVHSTSGRGKGACLAKSRRSYHCAAWARALIKLYCSFASKGDAYQTYNALMKPMYHDAGMRTMCGVQSNVLHSVRLVFVRSAQLRTQIRNIEKSKPVDHGCVLQGLTREMLLHRQCAHIVNL